MKIITLNIWGGRVGEDLLVFLKKHKDSTDVFCLQEVWSQPYFDGHSYGGQSIENQPIMVDGMQKISQLMTEFNCFFRPHLKDAYGLMTLVKRGLEVLNEGDIFVYKDKDSVPLHIKDNHARNLQYLNINFNGKHYTVLNFHGLWNESGKIDSRDRLIQSKKVSEFIASRFKNNVILCGDFNLLPNTESMAIIENSGLRNLVKEYKVETTRSILYKKPEKHADYILVSNNLKEKHFEVFNEVVSDHLPLCVVV